MCIKRIEWFLNEYNIQYPDHPYIPLLHILTKSNIKNKLLVSFVFHFVFSTSLRYSLYNCCFLTQISLWQKLSKRAMPNLIDELGSIKIIM